MVLFSLNFLADVEKPIKITYMSVFCCFGTRNRRSLFLSRFSLRMES